MRRQAEPQVDSRFQPVLELAVIHAQRGLEGRDHVADHIFGRIVQKRAQPPARIKTGRKVGGQILDHQAVLGDAEAVFAYGLTVPARDPGQTMGYVLDLDVERRGVKQVQPPTGQHALPGAQRCRRRIFP